MSGIVYTFYSFKGGVGRTMALANVAALLAKWGYSVLAVDWDLEAPGLEQFFSKLSPDIQKLRKDTPGIVDLVHASTNGAKLDWHNCLIPVAINGGKGKLSVLSAGRNDEGYSAGLQSINFPELFDQHGLGSYIEKLRTEWIEEFDFVLVDSRTGVTDIGGICTVHLADVLVLLFTANDSSSEGALEIVERARKAQQHLPLDRGRLLAVPVPARDESRTEYERAAQWKNRFAEMFGELYRDWLPAGKTPHDAIELLRIPYVPYWSFGEQLPAVVEGTADPASLGHAYQILARLLEVRLDWSKAMEQEMLAPGRRKVESSWLSRHREAALIGLLGADRNGFMEVCHVLTDSFIEKSQPELLRAAKLAENRYVPIGPVTSTEANRPVATNEGVQAVVREERSYNYWITRRNGDFFALLSFEEDRWPHSLETLDVAARIVWAVEALRHCFSFYTALGVQPNAEVELGVRHGGLGKRRLKWNLRDTMNLGFDGTDLEGKRTLEDEVSTSAIFRLNATEAEMVEAAKKLCSPLFAVFDFAIVPDEVYRKIVIAALSTDLT